MKLVAVTHPLDPPPLLLPGLLAHLALPPPEWFDPGLERSTCTLISMPATYHAARGTLEEIVGHRFPFVAANYYGQTHELRMHDDKPDLWGAVAIVGLGTPCDFSLIPAQIAAEPGDRARKPGVHLTFEHGDVIYLTEHANRHWHHGGLMPVGRYSLVLREHDPATHKE